MDIDVMLCVGVTHWHVLETKDVFESVSATKLWNKDIDTDTGQDTATSIIW